MPRSLAGQPAAKYRQNGWPAWVQHDPGGALRLITRQLGANADRVRDGL